MVWSSVEANLLAQLLGALDGYERRGYRQLSELHIFDNEHRLIGLLSRRPGGWCWQQTEAD